MGKRARRRRAGRARALRRIASDILIANAFSEALELAESRLRLFLEESRLRKILLTTSDSTLRDLYIMRMRFDRGGNP